MIRCMGEQYEGQFASFASVEGWHGKFGHLNLGILDHDSIVTGKGKHDRVVAFLPKGNNCYVRVDHVWSLGMPTEQQIRNVMRDDQDIRGKWKIDRIESWDNGKSTDIYLTRSDTRREES